MQTERVHSVIVVLACYLSIPTWAFADPPTPEELLPKPMFVEAPAAISAIADDQRVTVAGELDAIKALSKQLDRRIRRLEVMLEFDRVVRIRNAALSEWQKLQTLRDLLVDFPERDVQLRAKYFKAREDVDRSLQQLSRLDQ